MQLTTQKSTYRDLGHNVLWSHINFCLCHVFIMGEHTLLFHCVCIYIHCETDGKIVLGFFFSSWNSMENQTVYNFLLVIIRFHEAYTQLSVAGWPLKHQVKSLSQTFLNPILMTTHQWLMQHILWCFQKGKSMCDDILCCFTPWQLLFQWEFKQSVYFRTRLGSLFAQEKTDSVSLTMFVFFKELFHLASRRCLPYMGSNPVIVCAVHFV